jgi:uncharacterized protein
MAHTNPFRYGALALDESFTDRGAEIAELSADIRNGQDVVVLAPRRYGKSSLVWRVAHEVSRADVLVAHVNLMTAPTKEKLAEKLARTIYEDVASPLFRVRDRAVGVFRGLRIAPSISVDPDDATLTFGFDAGGRSEDVDATLERLLELPAQLAAERGRRVALVLDEFQEIVEIDPRLPRLMRSVFQEQPEVGHVYLGSRRHMMRRIFNDENEPFWRSAKQIQLGVIPPAEFAHYIADRFRATGKSVEPEALDAILEATGGHPYATQELCYFVWEEVRPGGCARVADVRGGLAGVLRSEHAHFTLLWEGASATQRLVLQALAESPGRPYTVEYRRRHRLPSASHVQKALGALVKREIVVNDGGQHRLAEPFLAEWIETAIARPAL